MSRVPICACGTKAIRQGSYWICGNAACPDFSEILRTLTDREKAAGQKVQPGRRT